MPPKRKHSKKDKGSDGPVTTEVQVASSRSLTQVNAQFPVELRRLAFEFAAADIPTALVLVLVSKQVKEWVDPILYHTVGLYPAEKIDLFSQMLKDTTKPAEFFQTCVKVLSIPLGDRNNTKTILSACAGAGLRSLALWTHFYKDVRDEMLFQNKFPNLVRFARSVNYLSPGGTYKWDPHPWSGNLAHVHMIIEEHSFEWVWDETHWDFLPHLRHMSMEFYPGGELNPLHGLETIAGDLGRSVETILVAAFKDEEDEDEDEEEEEERVDKKKTKFNFKDKRIVMFVGQEEYLKEYEGVHFLPQLQESWGNLKKGEKDVWEATKGIIAAQRSRKKRRPSRRS